MRPGIVMVVIWIAWAVSWMVAAAWSNDTQSQPSSATELRYRILMGIGALVMFVPAHGYEGRLRLWHIGWWGAWTCVALIAAGVAFAWWARLHLGRLWSGRITRKVDHRVVESGPYGIVRHPIYSGLLLSLIATAAAKGTLLGFVGLLFTFVGMWMKARLEERWLAKELGEAAYGDYRRRVPMLLPLGPTDRH
ncbi:MAG TPA: isoprenylcysteine carboxylmethyltransferase family protein [Steroidobacteraceae bacterium]|nr:isoprenylcysteine carboxylmethyltransferase family protein [Steroidobacteraceae bacterium]